MISISTAQWYAWISAFIYPLARILALISSAPLLGNRQIPFQAKLGLGVLLAILVAPTLEISSGIEPASARGMLILMQQIMLGLVMGFVMRIVFVAVEMAGEIIGLQMGLGFASFYDPQNASFTPVIGQFLGLIGVLAFLSMDGHLYMLAALAESFHSFPIAAAMPAALGFHTLAAWVGNLFGYALQLSLPVLGALLIANLALGILTRSAPQLNLFAVGFPITLALGFIALAMSLPYFVPVLEQLVHAGLNTMLQIAQQLQPH